MCAFLLDLLKTHDKKFTVTGEHSRISACTLPEWLPEDAIKETVDEFAKRLRKQLVDLYECEVLQVRGQSETNDTRRSWSYYNPFLIPAFFSRSDMHAARKY